MRFFIGADELRGLDDPLDGTRPLHIVQALSGG
jgi:hypothetical protein